MALRWLIALSCAVLLLCGCARKRTPRPLPDGSVALADHTAGKGCKRDEDCATGRCADALHITSASVESSAPGGYCTIGCSVDADCGLGGECAVPAGEELGECLGSCDSNDDCREGYGCVGAGSAAGLMIRGTCQPRAKAGRLDAGVAGLSCASDGDCRGGQCLRATPLGMSLPGSYCSARCSEDAQCGKGGACLVLAGSADLGYCYQHCAQDDDCTRDGYRCQRIGADFDACYPAPADLPDFTAGNPCSADEDCGGASHSCARELPFGTLSAYEIVPAPGGYCTQECSLDKECGAGAQCISRGLKGGLCLGNCEQMSDCRQGYTCITHGRDGDDGRQVCAPLIVQ